MKRVLDELLREQWLASSVSCEREKLCLNGLRVFDGDLCMVFVRPQVISEGFWLVLHGYDGAWSVLRSLVA